LIRDGDAGFTTVFEAMFAGADMDDLPALDGVADYLVGLLLLSREPPLSAAMKKLEASSNVERHRSPGAPRRRSSLLTDTPLISRGVDLHVAAVQPDNHHVLGLAPVDVAAVIRPGQPVVGHRRGQQLLPPRPT
jgi:hypothetical protein